MPEFPANEIKNSWGAISEAAMREPVTITKRGRPSLVLMATSEYEEIKRVYLQDLNAKVREGVEAARRSEFSKRSILDIRDEAKRRAGKK